MLLSDRRRTVVGRCFFYYFFFNPNGTTETSPALIAVDDHRQAFVRYVRPQYWYRQKGQFCPTDSNPELKNEKAETGSIATAKRPGDRQSKTA